MEEMRILIMLRRTPLPSQYVANLLAGGCYVKFDRLS